MNIYKGNIYADTHVNKHNLVMLAHTHAQIYTLADYNMVYEYTLIVLIIVIRY